MSSAADDKRYYTITEVAKMLNVNASLLRYWEGVFPGIKPKRNRKGSRFYTREHIEYLKHIHFLVKEKGYTLNAAANQLKHRKKAHSPQLAIKSTLENMRSFLLSLKEEIGKEKE